MPSPNTPAYAELGRRATRLYRFEHLIAIAANDGATVMPVGGNAARSAAIAELGVQIHAERTSPDLAALLGAAQAEPLSELEQANLREMRRDHLFASALPSALVEAKTLAGSRCEHAWRLQRPANDWKGFLANFREVLKLAREESLYLADATGLAPYDALIERYESGMRSIELDRVFGDLGAWLPDLIVQVRERQSSLPRIGFEGGFPRSAQRALNLKVMAQLGFDFEGGRLDESTHPYSGGVPEDVRLTTRYDESDFAVSLFATVHETGHSLYEQNLPRDWLGQPLARAPSMGIHESQSLFFEKQIGHSKAFANLLVPLLDEHFRVRFDAEALLRHFTRVAPGKIRVDADELTYPAHVILRYEIERALITGELEAEDIPAAWDEKMMSLLGIDTRGDYRDGCLQDAHWTDGSFGYFPSYTLGAMYAAQWFAEIRRTVPDVDARIASGDFAAIFSWLKDAIWSQASRWETGELVKRASGKPLDVNCFRAHLEARYLG